MVLLCHHCKNTLMEPLFLRVCIRIDNNMFIVAYHSMILEYHGHFMSPVLSTVYFKKLFRGRETLLRITALIFLFFRHRMQHNASLCIC